MFDIILTDLDLSRSMIYGNMKLPVDMSSTDRYKISLQAQSVSLYETKRSFCIDNASFISFIRPLGKVRSDKAHAENENGKFYTTTINVPNAEMDKLQTMSGSEEDSRWGSGYERGRTVSSSKSSPRKLSKSQAFENMYRIAAARQSSPQKKNSRSSKLYSKRVIHLPMFKLNLQTYVGEKEDTEFVENARQSLKEMIDVGRNASSNIKSLKSVSSQNDLKHIGFTKGNNVFRELSDVTPQSQGNNKQIEPRRSVSVQQGRLSVADTVDTDKMELKLDSLELRTWNSELSDVDDEVLTCVTGRRTKLYSEDMDRSGTCSTSMTHNSVWPSYDDIKRLRGDTVTRRNNESPIKAMEMKGRHLVSSNPHQAVQNWVENNDMPVLRYTNKQPKIKLDPIIVPSHTCGDCPVCKRAEDDGENDTPCPPNSPTLDDVLNEVALANNATMNESVYDSKALDRNSRYIEQSVRFSDKPSYIINRNNRPANGKLNSKQVRNSGKGHHPAVLAIPRVTVKILESKEQLQEATKINYVKGNII